MPAQITLTKQNKGKPSPNNNTTLHGIITRHKANKIKAASGSPKLVNNDSLSRPTTLDNPYTTENNTKKSKINQEIKCSTSVNTQTDINFTNITAGYELLSGQWISDETVHKYTDLISNMFLDNKPCSIINPIIVQAVKSVEDYTHFLQYLTLRDMEYIILPINDCQHLSKAGGWRVSLEHSHI